MSLKRQGEVKIKVQGQWRTVEVWTQGRSGTLAPTSYYFKYKGRWVTEFERKTRNWNILTLDWMKILYSNVVLRELVYRYNPLMKMIPKTDSFQGSYYPIPLIYGE